MIQIRGDGFHDLRVDARGDEFSRDADRVADGQCGGNTVADNDVSVHAEKRRAAGFFVVRFLADGCKRRF